MAEARGIIDAGEHFRLGALTTWSEIAAADLPPQFDALNEAARQVGGVQIQNAGTIGGNLCNASPAADGVPPLLMLDAAVELRSRDGVPHPAARPTSSSATGGPAPRRRAADGASWCRSAAAATPAASSSSARAPIR